MSPEMLKIYLGLGFGNIEPEKNDIFSLALTYLRLTFNLNENEI